MRKGRVAIAVAALALLGYIGAEGNQPPGVEAGPLPPAVPISASDVTAERAAPAPVPVVPDRIPDGAQQGVVEHVVDGDTIWVRVDEPGGPLVADATHKIRLLLVDTPETVHPSRPVACYGPEGSDFATEKLLGETVWLQADQQDTDRYGRFLRHVWLEDGTNFGLELVERGYADAVLHEPNDLYWDDFAVTAKTARSQSVGLWGSCERFGAPLAAEGQRDADGSSAIVDPAVPAATGDCDPSYPDVCIPPAPPDLDCGQIAHRRFAVVGPDPHGFDGDGDGVGCQSD